MSFKYTYIPYMYLCVCVWALIITIIKITINIFNNLCKFLLLLLSLSPSPCHALFSERFPLSMGNNVFNININYAKYWRRKKAQKSITNNANDDIFALFSHFIAMVSLSYNILCVYFVISTRSEVNSEVRKI